MALENAINFDLTDDDICMIDLNVSLVEATRFVLTKDDLANIDQSIELVQVTNVPAKRDRKFSSLPSRPLHPSSSTRSGTLVQRRS